MHHLSTAHLEEMKTWEIEVANQTIYKKSIKWVKYYICGNLPNSNTYFLPPPPLAGSVFRYPPPPKFLSLSINMQYADLVKHGPVYSPLDPAWRRVRMPPPQSL
jgi:hypothetical protein